jgi:hypothetical protein
LLYVLPALRRSVQAGQRGKLKLAKIQSRLSGKRFSTRCRLLEWSDDIQEMHSMIKESRRRERRNKVSSAIGEREMKKPLSSLAPAPWALCIAKNVRGGLGGGERSQGSQLRWKKKKKMKSRGCLTTTVCFAYFWMLGRCSATVDLCRLE